MRSNHPQTTITTISKWYTSTMKLFTCAVVRPFWPTDYTQVVRFACLVSLMDFPIHGCSPLCLTVTFYSKNYVSPDHASLVLLIYLVLNFLVGIYHLEFTLSMFISFWELSQLRSTRPCSFFFSHYCTSLSSPGHTCCPRSLASQTYQWEGWWNIRIWPVYSICIWYNLATFTLEIHQM